MKTSILLATAFASTAMAYSGSMTYFYQTGNAGACGGYNSDSEYIVALTSNMYDSGGYCGRTVCIKWGSSSATAKIVDRCPAEGCTGEGLDASPALFSALTAFTVAGTGTLAVPAAPAAAPQNHVDAPTPASVPVPVPLSLSLPVVLFDPPVHRVALVFPHHDDHDHLLAVDHHRKGHVNHHHRRQHVEVHHVRRDIHCVRHRVVDHQHPVNKEKRSLADLAQEGRATRQPEDSLHPPLAHIWAGMADEKSCPYLAENDPDIVSELNKMPPPNQQPAEGQKLPLSTEREVSSIPMGGKFDGKNWIYPSEQMFYNAMRRKNWSPHERDMGVVVPIHNAVNEQCWKKILEWEKHHESECNGPKLLKFEGKPKTYTPKARLLNLLGYKLPFDRHDWTVDRCGTTVRYVIDFYNDNGTVKVVKRLEYETYRPMAEKSMQSIIETARQKWPALHNVAVSHRIGEVAVGEESVFIAVSSPHRREALHAVEWLIDEIKRTVPIWKKEMYEDGSMATTFKWEDVSSHNTREDCWMVIDKKVYDITKFLDEHPGGEEVLLEQAGKIGKVGKRCSSEVQEVDFSIIGTDATEAFEEIGHSDDARDLLKKFYKGDLADSGKPPAKAPSKVAETTSIKADTSKPASSSSPTTILFALVPVAAAVAFIAYKVLENSA
ncbi:hypothetical protein HDU96_006942 [Phlyctochytrium bullatum]|nr:hypothetical protein HDU96_006942 [Phlyctochytrium bullatum]